MNQRRYLPSFAELLDRLSIIIQKELNATESFMKEEFHEERKNILHDINLFISEGVVITGEVIHASMLLQLVNHKIWENEKPGRGEGADGKNYELTHALNADRADIKKRIQNLNGGRIDHKLNYIPGFLKIEW